MKKISNLVAALVLAICMGGGSVALTSCSNNSDNDAALMAAIAAKTAYTITVSGDIAGGKISADKTSATAGETVALTATASAGYSFGSWNVKAADGSSVTVANNAFSMPAQNVTVSATFAAITYNINVGTYSNGSVSANPTTATAGTKVTLTASPSAGYHLDTLAVTDEGGASVSVSGTGNTRTFTMPAKSVTVAATFALPYKKTGTKTINGVDYDLVTFGSWPQTIKASSVEVTEQSESKTVGAFTYYKGSDGEWYAKIKENAFTNDLTYSDGTTAAQSSANSYKWFKVEPINWRVLTSDYNGKKLFFAESVLINCSYYDYQFVDRTVGGAVISPNNYEHSKVRAFLNGRSYQKKENDSAAQADCNDFLEKGFLQTAFTAEELKIIQDTIVDNSARSTNPDANATQWNNGINQSASDTPTTDKVFLLSAQEATKSAYGFEADDAFGENNARVRLATDYAKASGTSSGLNGGKGCWWWLRSPNYNYNYTYSVYYILANGYASTAYDGIVSLPSYGVAPALLVSN